MSRTQALSLSMMRECCLSLSKGDEWMLPRTLSSTNSIKWWMNLVNSTIDLSRTPSFKCHELRLSRGMNVTSTLNQDKYTNSLVPSVKCYTCHELSTIQMSRTQALERNECYQHIQSRHTHQLSCSISQMLYMSRTLYHPDVTNSISQMSPTLPSTYHAIIQISPTLLYTCHELSTIQMSLQNPDITNSISQMSPTLPSTYHSHHSNITIPII